MTTTDKKHDAILDNRNNFFSEVYRDYFPLIRNSIVTDVDSFDIAENLSHDVFFTFLLKLDNPDFFDDMKKNHRKVRKWLFETMKFTFINYYRKEKNMPDEISPHDVFENIALTFTNGMRDTRIILEEAVKTLTGERELLIFDYVAVQNYSYKKTGQILGFSKKQVSTRYNVIVNKILNYLKEKKGINNLEDLL
ncbi:MAG: sigma-70 family RNA polymerase sigma factor [bacterium]|nr:sigma-70 family RNA polymerase sigma factor [bacterium]